MNFRLFVCAIVAILSSIVPGNSVAAISGNDLLFSCSDKAAETTIVSRSFCVGYLEGLIEGVAVMKGITSIVFPPPDGAGLGEIVRQPFCLPTGVPNGEVAEKLVQYMTAHKEKLISPANGIVFTALSEIYPCARN